MALINFHCHSSSSAPDTISIRSFAANDPNAAGYKEPCSIGVHPWHTDRADLNQQLKNVESHLTRSNVIALGEVGLDKLKGASLAAQEDVLRRQVAMAANNGKPIVIHCVKAWDRLLSVKNDMPPSPQWAIHGFNGNAKLAEQLLSKGFFLSFGTNIIAPSAKLKASLKATPINRLFLETDTSGTNINMVYKAAAKHIGLPIQELEEQLQQNATNFFGHNT